MKRMLVVVLLVAATAAAQEDNLSAVWANEGGDKVARHELRASASPAAVHSSVWDGEQVTLFAARNEVVAFDLVLEAAVDEAQQVSVRFDRLDGPAGSSIVSAAATGDGVFDWSERPIEVFFVRYLQILGLSRLAYEDYDERHVPERFRRSWTGDGWGEGGWEDRPDHDAFYPDIAVPMELVGAFDVARGSNQSVWVDVWVPPGTRPGIYQGAVSIRQQGELTHQVPVRLEVLRFALPEEPSARTMLYLGYGDVNLRYTGTSWPDCGTPEAATSRLVRDRHFQLAHRHRVALIDGEGDCALTEDRPAPQWIPRLDGSLFTAANGYGGPGAGVGNTVYSIGTYGGWSWQGDGEAAMRVHTDAWQTWFDDHFPAVEHFLYLIDESDDYEQTEQWAAWMDANPGPGSRLMSMATISAPEAVAETPSLDVVSSACMIGATAEWQTAVDAIQADPGRRFQVYNGSRPASGSFATEDDGVALRVLGWTHFKKGVDRWFYWESTYYDNFQCGAGQTDVFASAQTFGCHDGFDEERGETGWNYTNGDGVLFYPGTDMVYPEESYGVLGPFASLRLKLWRRGLQDYEYLRLASHVDPDRVDALVRQMIPEVLWEVGVTDPEDPTWVRADISWSIDPDLWEAARRELADIIEAPRDCSGCGRVRPW